MKQITVRYWHLAKIPAIMYEDGQTWPYSTRRRTAIIDHVLKNNCSVMIRPLEDGSIVIWIDNGRFAQK